MRNSNDSLRHMSRRAALTRTALALGTTSLAGVRRARAQQKLTQAAAQYQDQPKGPFAFTRASLRDPCRAPRE